MRWLNILLGLAMLAFAAAQYNDPDGPLWAVYYLVPAFCALMAAFRSEWLRRPSRLPLIWIGVVIWFGLVVYYWPAMPGFWRKEVFMEEETAREGMGLMIAFLVMLVAAGTARGKPAR